MLANKQEIALGTAVYTKRGKRVGRIVEVGERCLGLLLDGDIPIWLGRQAIETIHDTGVVLTDNLLRKQPSIHDGLHLHGAAGGSADAA